MCAEEKLHKLANTAKQRRILQIFWWFSSLESHGTVELKAWELDVSHLPTLEKTNHVELYPTVPRMFGLGCSAFTCNM
jgi:hypothetical protein